MANTDNKECNDLSRLIAEAAAKTKPLARFSSRCGTLYRFQHGILGKEDPDGRFKLWPTADGQILFLEPDISRIGLSRIGVEKFTRRFDGLVREWSAIFRNEPRALSDNLFYEPARLWRQIAVAAAVAKDADVLQITQSIAYSFTGASIRLRDLAENYTRQFRNYRGYSIGFGLRSSYDEEVFVNTHSFLVELCAARDHLAQYVAKTRFNGMKVDTMARLRDVLQGTLPMNDAVGKLILEITDSSAQKGWMARLSRYRNIIVHQNPLPALKGANAADWKDLPLATGQIMKSISIYIPDDPCDIHNQAKCDLLDRCSDMLANMVSFSWYIAKNSPYLPVIESLDFRPPKLLRYVLSGNDPWSGTATLQDP
jgi:hypothetical protein